MRCPCPSLPRRSPAAAATLGLVLAWLSGAAPPAADAAAVPRAGADTAFTTYVLVRHAEKDTSMLGADVPLDSKGLARARELARVLGDVPFRHIYVTPWQRTRQTAQPLAARRGDSLTVIDAIAKTLDALRAEPRGARVLVVGHSNTVPQLVEGLTGRAFPTPDRVPHDGLWIVTRAPGGATTLLTLRYSAPDEVSPADSPPVPRGGTDTTFTTFVLVRHAEKDTGRAGADVPLNARGLARAQELARVLGQAHFPRIYITHWQRNRQTAEPLASRRGDSLTVIDEVGETLRALRAEPPGSTVLVVGHIYTIAPLIEGLTGRPFPIAGRVDHDDLWIVTRTPGAASLLTLRYGLPDEPAPAPMR